MYKPAIKFLMLMWAASLSSCFLLQSNQSIRQVTRNKTGTDTSHIYTLPFAPGKNVFVVQGYESAFSHKGSLAVDFKVKTGTSVYAARGGVVTGARDNSDVGGLKPENLADGNYILIQHSDGSEAQYWHFRQDGVLVNSGDTVTTGQLIGYSGNTGYSAFPHLHFEVSGYKNDGGYGNLPTRFRTQHGVVYLRPGSFYRVR